MCTALIFGDKNRYFGRTLDLEYRLDESIIITPRNYVFDMKFQGKIGTKFGIIGTGIIEENFPLYYDASNEMGLSMAGLNFVNNAEFSTKSEGEINLAPHELIPYFLGNFSCVEECVEAIKKMNLVNEPFNDKFPVAHLHWIISDKEKAITLECVKEGIKVYENPVGVLTNNPPFECQMWNLSNYINLTSGEVKNRFSNRIDLDEYSRGMGAIGLPGDPSSASRFVRACFTKLNAIYPQNEIEQVVQFFHVIGSVEQQEGCVKVGEKYERTQYTSCCDREKMIYYYTTYENTQINAVRLTSEDLTAGKLVQYKMSFVPSINYFN